MTTTEYIAYWMGVNRETAVRHVLTATAMGLTNEATARLAEALLNSEQE